MAQQKTATKTGGARRNSAKSLKKSGASRSGKESSVGDAEVSLDRRRGQRRGEEQANEETPAEAGPQLERRKKVNRRRQIDPTTCERDYTDQEVEFMNALDDYKRKSGRMFPTCSEVLEVIRSLGYAKISASELGVNPSDSFAMASAKPMPSDWSAISSSDNFGGEGLDSELESEAAF